MTIVLELPSNIESLAQAQAAAQGQTLETYLMPLVAQAVQEKEWQEENAAALTMAGSMPVLRRLWDTPEEDEAWKDL